MISLLKLILLWWIISVVVRWYRRMQAERAGRQEVPPQDDHPGTSDRVYSGKIEDAEFEDIDERNRNSS
ncbi:MAG: hypothetical protein Q8O92_09350 [Candidatus Latescibacter sp.]|nr:hypothetical protein [Candidatus Latescibacter sp.]